MKNESISWFENLTVKDVAQIGGKKASLGELIQALRWQGMRVSGGFATRSNMHYENSANNMAMERKVMQELMWR